MTENLANAQQRNRCLSWTTLSKGDKPFQTAAIQKPDLSHIAVDMNRRRRNRYVYQLHGKSMEEGRITLFLGGITSNSVNTVPALLDPSIIRSDISDASMVNYRAVEDYAIKGF